MKIPRAGRAGVAVAALAAATWALAGPLAHALPAPMSAAPRQWRAWVDHTDPTVAAFAVLRLAALAAAVAETAAVVVVALASVGRAASLVRVVVPRPLLGVAVLLVGATAAGCSRPPVAGARGPGPVAPATVTISGGVDPAPPAFGPAAPAVPTHVTVRRGDSLWLIAARVVSQGGGDPSDTPAVAAYWVRLLQANPLPDPNLVFPGQILVVPPFGHKGE